MKFVTAWFSIVAAPFDLGVASLIIPSIIRAIHRAISSEINWTFSTVAKLPSILLGLLHCSFSSDCKKTQTLTCNN